MRQVLFQIGPLKFYAYGLMLGISFAAGIFISLWRARRENVSQDHVFTIAVSMVIAALLGSKLLHVLVNFRSFLEKPSHLFTNFGGGFVFFGGFLACIVVIVLFDRSYRIGILRLFDIYAPAVALGLGFTRIGCFLSGCCYGQPCDLPWAVTFPAGSFAAKNFGPGIAVHPTQLYSSLNGFILFLVLLAFLKWHGKRYHGQVFAIFATLYSVFRFLVEFIRADSGRGFYFGLYTSQWISMLFGMIGIAILVYYGVQIGKRLEKPVYL